MIGSKVSIYDIKRAEKVGRIVDRQGSVGISRGFSILNCHSNLKSLNLSFE